MSPNRRRCNPELETPLGGGTRARHESRDSTEDVFISYSRKDTAFVRLLHQALEQRQRKSWVDSEGIPLSANWMETIYSAIEGAKTFVFIISPDSAASEICAQELAHAVKLNKRLVPVVHRDVAAEEVPKALSELNWIFCRISDVFEKAFESLLEAIDTDLDWVRLHTRLSVRAGEWERKNRNQSFLLRGVDLEEAEQWLSNAGQSKNRNPTSLQTEYLIASRVATIRRQRKTIFGVTVALLVAIALALVAFYQYRASENRRRIGLSRQLSAQSLNLLDDRLDLALLLNVEALRSHNTFEARNSLLTALQRRPRLKMFLRGYVHGMQSGGLTSDQGRFTAVAFSSDGHTVAAKQWDDTMHFWDAYSGLATRQPIKRDPNWYDLVLSPNFARLAARGPVGFVLKDLDTGRVLQLSTNNPGDSSVMTFSPDGQLIALGGGETLALWDTAKGEPSGQPLRQLSPGAMVLFQDFSPDGNTLAFMDSVDQEFELWDISTRQKRPFKSTAKGMVRAVSFSPDGKRIAVAMSDGSSQLWDISREETREEKLPYDAVTDAGSDCIAFDPKGRFIAGGDRKGKITLWDVLTRQQVDRPFRAHNGPVASLGFSPDGNSLVSCGDDGAVVLWNVNHPHLLADVLPDSPGRPGWAAFSPDGKLFGRTFDGGIWLWELPAQKLSGEPLRNERDSVKSFAFSPDGSTIVAGCAGERVLIWNVASRHLVGNALQANTRRDQVFCSIAFNADGKLLATGSSGRAIFLWDALQRKQMGEALSPSVGDLSTVNNLVFLPDNKTLLAGGNISTCWDLVSRKAIENVLEDHDRAQWVAFSREARLIAGSTAQGILLWDWTNRKRTGELMVRRKLDQSHWDEDKTIGLAFSPDGQILASQGEDTGLLLWDIGARQQLGLPLNEGTGAHSYDSINIAFSPDGKTLAAPYGMVQALWDTSLDSWITKAQRIANRNLTRAEWKQFFGDEPYHKTCPELSEMAE